MNDKSPDKIVEIASQRGEGMSQTIIAPNLCPDCKGKGDNICPDCCGRMEDKPSCNTCGGYGREYCETCKGTGKAKGATQND